jgi:transposase
MSRPNGSAEALEQRRVLALKMIEQGVAVSTVARAIGVDRCSVSRWKKQAREGTLAAKPRVGKPGLGLVQLAFLLYLLRRGAKDLGWTNDLWTAARVRRLIEDWFGITYHVEHVRYILKKKLNFSSQRPELRARERDEKEIERWLREELPRIKKIGAGQGRLHCSAG